MRMSSRNEFVFELPGNPGFRNHDGTLEWDKKFPIMSLQDYDQIFEDAIRTWESNVKQGFVLLYQRQKHPWWDDIPLGLIAVEEARRKFR